MKKSVRVELLAHTPQALSLVYAAFRQCYSAGFVGDMWPRLLAGEIPLEKQAEFVENTLKSGHDSPLEHVSFTFAVEGISRACSHQFVRHRIASYSQQSQRYCAEGDHVGFIMPPAIQEIPEARERFEQFMDTVNLAYSDIRQILINSGRVKTANEDARFVLPNAAETKIVVTMNCRALLNFFRRRCCQRAQWEIRAVANEMLRLCRNELPTVFNVAGAPCLLTRWCPEGKFGCGKYPTGLTSSEDDPVVEAAEAAIDEIETARWRESHRA